MSIIGIIVAAIASAASFLSGRYVFPAGEPDKVAESLSDSEPIRTACSPKFIREFGAPLCIHMRCGQTAQAVKGDRPDASECAEAMRVLNTYAVRKDCVLEKTDTSRRQCFRNYWPNRND